MRLQIHKFHIHVRAEKQVCNGEEAGAPGAVRWPLWRVAGRQERKIAGAEEGRKVERCEGRKVGRQAHQGTC